MPETRLRGIVDSLEQGRSTVVVVDGEVWLLTNRAVLEDG